MRHGFSDEVDNGWGDFLSEVRPETDEERAERFARIDALEAARAAKLAVKEAAYAAIRATGACPDAVAQAVRGSGNMIVKFMFGDATFAVVSDKTICPRGWCDA